jgi:acyl-CoA synthetase (NDP forming)
VVLYRAGRTSAGSLAAASHTASIAGDYAVTRALAEAAGAVVAESLEDFDDLVRLFCLLRDKQVAGLGLGALSNAGFECVAMADNLGAFELPEFRADTQERLAAILEQHRLLSVVGVKNLLDLTPIVDDAAYEEAVRCVLEDESVDVAVIGCVPLSGALSTVAAGEGYDEDVRDEASIAMRMARLHAASKKAWVAVVDGGPLYDAMARLLLEKGVPTFRSADRALRLFGRYCRWRRAWA